MVTVKNLHLEHIEDEIFNLGFRGARESINFYDHYVICHQEIVTIRLR